MRLLRTLLYMDSTITIHISIQEKEFIVDVKHINPQINDFEKAIKLVRCLGIKNVQLRQDDKINGGTIEWDNF